MDNSHSFDRGLGLYNPAIVAGKPITIVGCGGIGSYLALSLVKLGVNTLHLIDNDEVEDVNLGGQIYGIRDVGRPKVEALAEHIRRLSPQRVNITTQHERVATVDTCYALFSAVDSMETRSALYGSALAGAEHFFDGRIGGDYIRAYAVEIGRQSERKQYASTLYSDDEASPLPCTEQNVAYLGFTIAGMLTRLFAASSAGLPRPWEILHHAPSFHSLPSILTE